jgi:hypothetical protein
VAGGSEPLAIASGGRAPRGQAARWGARRRLLAAIARGASATLLGLAGCTSGETPAAETPAGVPAREPVTLELWLPGRQDDAEALEPIHRWFMAETPAVVGVNVRLVTNETMMEQLTASLAAGTPPDVGRLKEYRLAVPLFQRMTASPEEGLRRVMHPSLAATPPGGVLAVPDSICGFVEMHGSKVAVTLSVTVRAESVNPGL